MSVKLFSFIGLVLLCSPAVFAQTLPLNGYFQLVGENGSLVTVSGDVHTSRESAAKYWDQTIAVPGSSITTELLPSTHPRGGTMIHFITNNGYYAPVTFGNGLGWAR